MRQADDLLEYFHDDAPFTAPQYFVEKARSNNTICHTTGKKIKKDALRIGVLTRRREFNYYQWHKIRYFHFPKEIKLDPLLEYHGMNQWKEIGHTIVIHVDLPQPLNIEYKGNLKGFDKLPKQSRKEVIEAICRERDLDFKIHVKKTFSKDTVELIDV